MHKCKCESAYPQGIQDVDDFVSLVEYKQRFFTQTIDTNGPLTLYL